MAFVAIPTTASASPAATSNELHIETFENMLTFKNENVELMTVVKTSGNKNAMDQMLVLAKVGTHLYKQCQDQAHLLKSLTYSTEKLTNSTSILSQTNSILTDENRGISKNEKALMDKLANLEAGYTMLASNSEFFFQQYVRSFRIKYFGFDKSIQECNNPKCKSCGRPSQKHEHRQMSIDDCLTDYFSICKTPIAVQSQIRTHYTL